MVILKEQSLDLLISPLGWKHKQGWFNSQHAGLRSKRSNFKPRLGKLVCFLYSISHTPHILHAMQYYYSKYTVKYKIGTCCRQKSLSNILICRCFIPPSTFTQIAQLPLHIHAQSKAFFELSLVLLHPQCESYFVFLRIQYHY